MQATSTQFWLNILHDLAYDIDDLLDEMVTEALVSQLNLESHAILSMSQAESCFIAQDHTPSAAVLPTEWL